MWRVLFFIGPNESYMASYEGACGLNERIKETRCQLKRLTTIAARCISKWVHRRITFSARVSDKKSTQSCFYSKFHGVHRRFPVKRVGASGWARARARISTSRRERDNAKREHSARHIIPDLCVCMWIKRENGLFQTHGVRAHTSDYCINVIEFVSSVIASALSLGLYLEKEKNEMRFSHTVRYKFKGRLVISQNLSRAGNARPTHSLQLACRRRINANAHSQPALALFRSMNQFRIARSLSGYGALNYCRVHLYAAGRCVFIIKTHAAAAAFDRAKSALAAC